MRPETQQLCDLVRQRTIGRAGASFESGDWQCSVSVGTTRLTIDEAGNTNPAIINVNIGTTISYQEIDDPALLPAPTSGRYQARLGDETVWEDVTDGEEVTSDELATRALATFEGYIAQAR